MKCFVCLLWLIVSVYRDLFSVCYHVITVYLMLLSYSLLTGQTVIGGALNDG